MRKKKICFRFDVDTHKCAKIGIPKLLDLARHKNVSFTFFINCGKAIDISASLKAMLSNSQLPNSNSIPQLSALRKFGYLEYLRCAILNPQILSYAKNEVQKAHQEGHEIGLHGGSNHELWGRFVNQWSDDKIRHEIQWGLDQLRRIGITPNIFSSPLAAGGERVRKLVSEFKNFQYISDDLNPASEYPKSITDGVLDVPTCLCGEGGVAYIEQLVAKGFSEKEIVRTFEQRLQQLESAVFYDHPYFAGDEALPILSRLIDCAKENGFEVSSLTEIGHIYENNISSKIT